MNDPHHGDEEERPRPIPVRAAVGDEAAKEEGGGDTSRPRPARPRSVRESLGEGEGGAADGRPTPVRATMAPEPAQEPVEQPTRAFQRGDEAWVARVEGRSRTGLPGDPGRAPLLLVSFAREGTGERPELEVLRVGRTLEGLTEDELLEGLDRARPYRGPQAEREELFAETRKGHPGR